MKTRLLWSNILLIVGLIAMLIGAIDPLEGSLIILLGSGMIALSAFLVNNRYRRLLYYAFVMIVIGIGLMFGLSMFGGLGGSTGRSLWWALVIIPYPVGWIMGLIGVILRFRELYSGRIVKN